MEKVAIIRIKGQNLLDARICKALDFFRLYKKNFCVVVDKNKNLPASLNEYVTWGEIDDETYNLLVEKRGEPYLGVDKKSKYVLVNSKKIKPFFRLSPPRKGYGRNGTKAPFKKGGALGYRGAKINDLLRRMI